MVKEQFNWQLSIYLLLLVSRFYQAIDLSMDMTEIGPNPSFYQQL